MVILLLLFNVFSRVAFLIFVATDYLISVATDYIVEIGLYENSINQSNISARISALFTGRIFVGISLHYLRRKISISTI